MARSKITALDVNGTGTDTVFIGGNLAFSNTDILGVSDIFLDDINADGIELDIFGDVEMNDNSLHNGTGNLDINANTQGNSPTTFGASGSRPGTEQDIEVFGDMHCDGQLSKGSGTFKINHPLDPENKYLYHSFVESPEMRNMYYGQVQTTGMKAIVTMPDWWHALNGTDKTEFNYQLTPIGKKAILWVSKELENGSFEISSDVECKISWQVSAIRHDKIAEENRVIVEVPKNKALINKFPDMHMVSDLYEYDSELDSVYKKSKKDLFLLQKPHLIQQKRLSRELKLILQERKSINERSKKFNITGTPKEIELILKNRTQKEKDEIETIKSDTLKNKQKKKKCQDDRLIISNLLRDVNKNWRAERNVKRMVF